MKKLFYAAIVTLLSLNFICGPITVAAAETETDDGISVVSDLELPQDSGSNPKN